jgi:hypothetical protein
MEHQTALLFRGLGWHKSHIRADFGWVESGFRGRFG